VADPGVRLAAAGEERGVGHAEDHVGNPHPWCRAQSSSGARHCRSVREKRFGRTVPWCSRCGRSDHPASWPGRSPASAGHVRWPVTDSGAALPARRCQRRAARKPGHRGQDCGTTDRRRAAAVRRARRGAGDRGGSTTSLGLRANPSGMSRCHFRGGLEVVPGDSNASALAWERDLATGRAARPGHRPARRVLPPALERRSGPRGGQKPPRAGRGRRLPVAAAQRTSRTRTAANCRHMTTVYRPAGAVPLRCARSRARQAACWQIRAGRALRIRLPADIRCSFELGGGMVVDARGRPGRPGGCQRCRARRRRG
jgi:hypothetical protein